MREGLSRLTTRQELPDQMLPIDLRKLGESLKRLEQAVPKLKQKIVSACTHTALMDGTVTVEEAELLRAVVIALGCPMPPILNTFKSSSKSGSRSVAA